MPRGISLHVGINQVSSAFPNATPLRGCQKDAEEMEKIAIAEGFEVHDVLLGSDATYARVTAKIRSAAAQLQQDDIFLFTFAGHGFQETDIGARDEEDRLDETLLLFDVELFDDVLRKDLWPRFEAGVRVLMISDCCHSGSNFLIPPEDPADANLGANTNVKALLTDEFPVSTPDRLSARVISKATGRRHQAEYGEFYRSTLLPIFSPPINACLMLLAACEDDETTGDGVPNGIYTATMLRVLNDSNPPVDYDDLVQRIQTALTEAGRTQTPTLKTAGSDHPTFRKQRPFTI